MKANLLLMITAASLVLAACNGAPEATTAGEPETRAERMQALDAAIRNEVGIPRATSIEQCQLIAVGKRACGGPQYYMVYSSAASDAQLLSNLVTEYTELRVKQLQETNEMGTCVVVPKPVVGLSGGLCVMRKVELY